MDSANINTYKCSNMRYKGNYLFMYKGNESLHVSALLYFRFLVVDANFNYINSHIVLRPKLFHLSSLVRKSILYDSTWNDFYWSTKMIWSTSSFHRLFHFVCVFTLCIHLWYWYELGGTISCIHEPVLNFAKRQ